MNDFLFGELENFVMWLRREVRFRSKPTGSAAAKATAAVLVGTYSFFLGLNSGCSVKRTVSVPVSTKVLLAKTATLQELLGLLDRSYGSLEALSSTSVKVSLTTGRVESGRLQEYRSAPGYLLLRRPAELRLNIQNPLTKTTIADLASRGNDFAVWYPRDNKYFIGQNSAREFEVEGDQKSLAFTARPIDIYDAVLPGRVSLSDPHLRVAFEEASDAEAKYYVVSLFETVEENRLRPVRRLWFERSELSVVKQQSFEPDGSVASIVEYSDFSPIGGMSLPLSIHMERPGDGYSLEMQFRSWRVNPEIPDTAFVLSPPPSAQWIHLKDKTTTGKP